MSAVKNGTYTIDAAHSSVEFAVKHLMITTVKGWFSDVEGTVTIPERGQPSVEVTIRAASITTRNDARDTHLRSADFFDVEQYPTLRFVSTAVQPTDDGYRLTGDLTIKDVTRSVTLTVVEDGVATDPYGNEKASFSARGKFNRTDFGLTWNGALETGGVLVSEEVKINIDAQLTREKKAGSRAA